MLLIEVKIAVLRGGRQAEPAHGGAAPPLGAVLTGPVGVPRRGKGRIAPNGGRVIEKPPSSRGRSKEGIHRLPRRSPSETFSRAVIEECIDSFQCRRPDCTER